MRVIRAPRLKIVAFMLVVIVLSVTIYNGTIAFFTDTKESESVFTSGHVYIELTEAATKYDQSGNLIEDTSADRFVGNELTAGGNIVVNNYGTVFPGQTIFKDPTVKNTGIFPAWVAVKVIIDDGVGDIYRLFKYSDEYDDIDIEQLLCGGLLDEYVHVGEWNGIPDVCYNDRYAMIQTSDHINGKFEFYFIMNQPLKMGESVTVFDTMQIDPTFGNSEMLEFRDLKITIQAFAVQTYGFNNCRDAMTGAFDEHFKKIAP